MKLPAVVVTIAPIVVCAAAYLDAPQQVLNSGGPVAEIPPIGFGTWNLDKSNASDAVVAAFRAGYRHIDCAAIYGNEREVGEGIRRAMESEGLRREDFWVTSKLWNDRHDPLEVPFAIARTLKDLQLSYLDLYHMHWPVAEHGGVSEIDFIATWTAMAALPDTTSAASSHPPVRFVGVSNFSPAQLDAILPIHKPYAHQMELHPYLPQMSFVDLHEEHDIHVTAYSPLGNANPTYGSGAKGGVQPLLETDLVKGIAAKQGCTPAQVVLQWGMQRGTSVIPKSQHKARIEENWESLGCELTGSDLTMLGEGLPVKRFNNPSKSWGVDLYEGLQDA